ncbi:hypothetical protein TRVL_04160 [Trypanosoma vivax]|nr:hypothetical protein TRVL_04160 [Trypanosoma vivax]
MSIASLPGSVLFSVVPNSQPFHDRKLPACSLPALFVHPKPFALIIAAIHGPARPSYALYRHKVPHHCFLANRCFRVYPTPGSGCPFQTSKTQRNLVLCFKFCLPVFALATLARDAVYPTPLASFHPEKHSKKIPDRWLNGRHAMFHCRRAFFHSPPSPGPIPF